MAKGGLDFVMDVYRNTKVFPRDETYALAGELRKTAVAISTNIAERQARFSPIEFHFLLAGARGALVEVETSLMTTQNLAYFAPEHGRQWLDKGRRVRRMLNGLIGAIRPAA